METGTETKKRGRPPKGDQPMSGRVWTLLYRQRRSREKSDAIGFEPQARSAVLIDLLRENLAQLDRGAGNVTATKSAVERILRELCHRYEIDL